MELEQNVTQEKEGQSEEVQAVTPEVDAEQVAMMAAISEARGNDMPASEPQTQAEPQAAESNVEAEAPAEAETVKTLIAGMTEDQVKALLAQASEVPELKSQLRMVHGRFGDLNSRLQQMQHAGQQGGQGNTVRTEAPGDLKVSVKKALSALMDGDMDSAEESLVSVLSQRGTGAPAPVAAAQDASVVEGLKKEILTLKYESWEDDIASPDFALWKQTQTPEVQHQIANSNSTAFAAKKLGEFYEWRDKNAQARQQQEQQQQQSNNRLERAITPSGSGSVPQPNATEEEAMQAAIRAHMRPRVGAT